MRFSVSRKPATKAVDLTRPELSMRRVSGEKRGPRHRFQASDSDGHSELHGIVDSLASRIGARELRRRVWHFFPGILALALTPVPHLDPIPLPRMAVLVAIGIILPIIVAFRFYGTIERHADDDRISTVLGYGGPMVPLFLLFPGHVELGLAAVGIVAFGDGTATVMGMLYGRAKLPWNRNKSWIGAASFFVAATLLSSLIYWIEASPHLPMGLVLTCIAPAAAICALVETIPGRLNDNLSVSTTAAVMLVVMQELVIGWP